MIAIRERTWEQAAAASGPGALAAGLFLWLMMATGAAAQQAGGYVDGGEYDDYRVSARVWLDRGQEPVVERGDRVRVFYRTSADAYVAIFHIDTNGTTRLVHPRSPEENHWVRGNRDYRLLFPRSPFWYVDDHPGIGYYFIVASPEPFDFSLLDYSYYDGGWDLRQVGRTVYSDPYVAMDDYVAALVPDWERVPYALDFASYNVGQDRYDYPRFLCYDCHDFRSFDSWNPYHYACTSFRVVIYDDPYYYPAYRYRGDRVVYVRPPIRRLPRFDFKERAEDEPPAPLVATRASNGTATPRPGVPGDVARRTPSGVGSGGEGSGESTGREAVQRSGAGGGGSAGVSGDVRRRDGSGGSAGGTGGAGAIGSDETASRRDALLRRGVGAIDATGGGAVGGEGEAGARDGRGGSATGDAARWGSSSRRIVVPRRTDEANETRERRFVPVIPRSGGEAAGGGTGASGGSGAAAGRTGESGTAGEGRGSLLRRFIPAARSGEERGRPVLERRPTSKAGVTRGEGGSGATGATGGASGASGAVERRGSGSGGDVGRAGGEIRRPTERVRGSSGSSGGVVRRSGDGGSSGGTVRPPVRIRSGGGTGSSGSSGGAVRRSGSSGSSGGSVRPPVRIRSGGASGSSGSSGGAVRRSGGSGSSGGSVRPPVRIRSGGASGSSGSSGSSGRAVRRSGGGSSGGDISKPPVRIRRSGSGGF